MLSHPHTLDTPARRHAAALLARVRAMREALLSSFQSPYKPHVQADALIRRPLRVVFLPRGHSLSFRV